MRTPSMWYVESSVVLGLVGANYYKLVFWGGWGGAQRWMEGIREENKTYSYKTAETEAKR